MKPFYLFLALTLLASCSEDQAPRQSGAGKSLEFWAWSRAYPEGRIRTDKWFSAFESKKAALDNRGGPQQPWKSLGPKNIGGRTLCLAFHPDDPGVIYAGSASGGLWKTTSAGTGPNAWSYVPTGFPLLGVGAIAINPYDPDIMFIGTGEVYNYFQASPGIINRTTRGTYGIGILKTTDGGLTWEKSLDWSQEELTGVQDIVINHENTETIYAATTRGLLRSYDGGENWSQVIDPKMAVDIEMHPTDTLILYVTFGGYQSPDAGVYRSKDGGQTFELLDNGIPSDYTGKTLLSVSQSNPDILYASVANAFDSNNLYRSLNGGTSWEKMNEANVATYQGWYSHDVLIHPDNPNEVFQGGIDWYYSPDGGLSPTKLTYWYNWYFGQVPAGGPEGPPDYVHADTHAAYFHPLIENHVYLATDGGIFVSADGGFTFEGRNGGYQTQQFYANFSNSPLDSNFAIGGMQDNASALYLGDDDWYRVIGGDGMSTAIYALNDDIVFGSSQGLNLLRSLDGGLTFGGVTPDYGSDARPFNGPYELCPSVPARMYAGTQRLFRSDDLGDNWNPVGGQVDQGNMILKIAAGPQDADLIYISTVPVSGSTQPPRLKKSINAGGLWQNMAGLPDRVCTDIAIHPVSADTVFAVFSGYGTPHVYRTLNGGVNWAPLEQGVPDLPVNTILFDPNIPGRMFLGNDIGVYESTDLGESWAPFGEGLPDAVLAMDLCISPQNNKLRLATHGHGVYEASLDEEIVSVGEESRLEVSVWPNPAAEMIWIRMAGEGAWTWLLYDTAGRIVMQGAQNEQTLQLSLKGLRSGLYWLECRKGNDRQVRKIVRI